MVGKYDGPRGRQADPENMLEVELEEEMSLPDEGYDECTLESGEVFVSIL